MSAGTTSEAGIKALESCTTREELDRVFASLKTGVQTQATSDALGAVYKRRAAEIERKS